ncbi:MAG TPA: winged helix-turn-helix domain-containing protein [Rhodanobacteraceae bacterium]|nr:winged helix-turn-helix domain-containing protein [Rhodanobacteraceae bacterium]
MEPRHYRFGRFRLNPQARELFDGAERVNLPLSTIDSLIYLVEHRDRPVGRDELAAAVWGRVDVSEVSLSHAIMRLRKLLGDTGNEQRAIRTVPRLGYRWVMEGTVESDAEADAAPIASESSGEAIATEPQQSKRTRYAVLAIAALVLVAFGIWFARERVPSPIAKSGPMPAIVLPATVDASPEQAWVRLGLMDLVASELRRGGIATAPSENIVALTRANDGAFDRHAFPDALIVEPTAKAARGGWSITLDVRAAGREIRVAMSAADPIDAGRKAADELLIKLGHVPPAVDEADASVAQATLRQRVTAAVLSGQLDVARDLIRTAAPNLKATPEIAFSEAKIEFFAGNTAKSREKIEALLARLPADAPGELRARALNTLGAAYFREGRLDEAGRAYAESIRLAAHTKRNDVLANAYIGSGGVASQRLSFDEAAADYGRARTLLDLGNDAFGVAAVDLNLGMLALERGQPAAALPVLRGAATEFTKLAGEDALAAALAAIVDADLAVLDEADALATSERLATLESRNGGRERWDLVLVRARALASAGKLAGADALLARIADASDPAQDATVRARASALGAEIALARGDCAHAAELSAAAVTPGLDAAHPPDYARAARIRIEALFCNGDAIAATDAADRLRQWSATAPAAATGIEVLRAEAARAKSAGANDAALDAYARAMAAATARAIPDEIVGVGLDYVRVLLAAGDVDEAASVNGRTAAFADRDPRAALIEALVYAALGRNDEADDAFAHVRKLAGERTFAELPEGRNRTAGP